MEKLVETFNVAEASIRVVALLSPDQTMGANDFELIRRLFSRFDSNKLSGLVIWNAPSKEVFAQAYETLNDDSRINQFWDAENSSMQSFSKLLHVEQARNIYLLYSPRMRWEVQERAPDPVLWIQSVTSDHINNTISESDFSRFIEETKFLLETEDPELSDKGLMQVLLEKEKKTSEV